MRLAVIANPAAGSGRRAGAGARVVAALRAAGHDAAVVAGAGRGEVSGELERAVAAGAEGVVAVGGDGTVHLALQVLAGTGVPLGIVPTGTGNDVARGLGLLRRDAGEATAALVAALDRPPRVLDAVAVEGAGPEHAWFAGVLSAGFDAAVNERGNALRWPRGAARYVLAVGLEVAHLRAWRYRLVLDGEASTRDAALVTVGNTTSVGGGMRLLPDADPADGVLDVLVASPLRRRELLAIFPRVFTGRHVGDPHVRIERARTVVLGAAPVAGAGAVTVVDAVPVAGAGAGAVAGVVTGAGAGAGALPVAGAGAVPVVDAVPVAYADGERLGPLPLTLICVPGALRVFS